MRVASVRGSALAGPSPLIHRDCIKDLSTDVTDDPPQGGMKTGLVPRSLMSVSRISLCLKPSKPFRLNISCLYLRHLRHVLASIREAQRKEFKTR